MIDLISYDFRYEKIISRSQWYDGAIQTNWQRQDLVANNDKDAIKEATDFRQKLIHENVRFIQSEVCKTTKNIFGEVEDVRVIKDMTNIIDIPWEMKDLRRKYRLLEERKELKKLYAMPLTLANKIKQVRNGHLDGGSFVRYIIQIQYEHEYRRNWDFDMAVNFNSSDNYGLSDDDIAQLYNEYVNMSESVNASELKLLRQNRELVLACLNSHPIESDYYCQHIGLGWNSQMERLNFIKKQIAALPA